jgi:hypothetical protein
VESREKIEDELDRYLRYEDSYKVVNNSIDEMQRELNSK